MAENDGQRSPDLIAVMVSMQALIGQLAADDRTHDTMRRAKSVALGGLANALEGGWADQKTGMRVEAAHKAIEAMFDTVEALPIGGME